MKTFAQFLGFQTSFRLQLHSPLSSCSENVWTCSIRTRREVSQLKLCNFFHAPSVSPCAYTWRFFSFLHVLHTAPVFTCCKRSSVQSLHATRVHFSLMTVALPLFMEQGSQHCSHGNPLLRPLLGVLKEERSLARDGVHLRRNLKGKRGFRESGGLGGWPPVTVVLEQGFWRRTFSLFTLWVCCSQLGWWQTQSSFLKEHFGFPVRCTFRISFIWICMIYDAQKYSLLIYFCIEIAVSYTHLTLPTMAVV